MSLTVKLQRRCDSLSTDQIKLIARRLPRDMDALETILSKEEISTMGESVLSITQKHERNRNDSTNACASCGPFRRLDSTRCIC